MIGSFTSVVAHRWPRGESFVLSRSRCPSCGHKLAATDLVPLLSYARRKGRCRYCAKPISARYPALELVAFLVAVSAAWSLDGWLVWASCGLGWTLLALAAIDLESHRLPDFLTLPLIAAGLIVTYWLDDNRLLTHALAAAGAYSFFIFVNAIYKSVRGRDGLGHGDAKLFAAAGAWLGPSALPSVLAIATLLALVTVLVPAGQRGEIAWRTRIPFGPHLCFGIWLVWLSI